MWCVLKFYLQKQMREDDSIQFNIFVAFALYLYNIKYNKDDNIHISIS